MTIMKRHLRPIFFALILTLAFSPSFATYSPYLIPNTSESSNSSKGNANSSSSKTLLAFERQVYNGVAGQITGLYVENKFAYPVHQQPEGHPEFVDPEEDTVTQFSSATFFGSFGFLAHNFKAGKNFPALLPGEIITIVYGDDQSASFAVKEIRRFQVVNPDSTVSDFIDLETGDTLSVYDLFYETYGIAGNLVLQTCISANGIANWGRLFVIAEPTTMQISSSQMVEVPSTLGARPALTGNRFSHVNILPL
jgi:hypothetical protein